MKRLIVLFVVLLGSCATMSALLLKRHLETSSYEDAERCADGKPGDCVAEERAEIRDRRRTGGRGPSFTLTLRLLDRERTVQVTADQSLYDAFPAGTRVKVETWRDRVVRIEREGAMETLPGKARRGQTAQLAIVVALAFLTGFVGWRLTRAART